MQIALYIGLLIATLIVFRFLYQYRKDGFHVGFIFFIGGTYIVSTIFSLLTFWLLDTHLYLMYYEEYTRTHLVMGVILVIVWGFVSFALLAVVFVAFNIAFESLARIFKFFLIHIVFTLLVLGLLGVAFYKLWQVFTGGEHLSLGVIVTLVVFIGLMFLLLHTFYKKDAYLKLSETDEIRKTNHSKRKLYVEKKGKKKKLFQKDILIASNDYLSIYLLLGLIAVFFIITLAFFEEGTMLVSGFAFFFTVILFIILIKEIFTFKYFQNAPLVLKSELQNQKEFKGYIRLKQKSISKSQFNFELVKSKRTSHYDDFEDEVIYKTEILYSQKSKGKIKVNGDSIEVHFSFLVKAPITDDWKLIVNAKNNDTHFNKSYTIIG